MDQMKIGAFIAAQRKEQNFTQMQLAELLNISNRAVSKWETGKSLPDVSIMPQLCVILDISLTELLNGEKIKVEENGQWAESSILEILMTQKNLMHKKHWSDMLCGAGVGITFSVLYAPDSLRKAITALIGLVMICTGWYLEKKIERTLFQL